MNVLSSSSQKFRFVQQFFHYSSLRKAKHANAFKDVTSPTILLSLTLTFWLKEKNKKIWLLNIKRRRREIENRFRHKKITIVLNKSKYSTKESHKESTRNNVKKELAKSLN